ncbi:hypothetical protein A8A54_04380 [Brucella pseudogrignonensis]|uniref:hypothetical protein n=1 Tax=Brucella pseudogrignonensis TaxID=419475 RepID=UPI0007DA7EE8|nr:hypothetical protein [Brucella pseudogrignonensis]ANG95788.1 hypothetical protein A8A54_04380 [Brucella pseudogrignonensis]
MTNPFTEFFAKHAEMLETNNTKAEAFAAEKPYSVEAYIADALSIDDEDDFDDEDTYDFDPVPEDDEPAPRFTP